jgi:hypothetical protein
MVESSVRPVWPPLRALIVIAGGLVLLAGFQLFVLSEQTDRFLRLDHRPAADGSLDIVWQISAREEPASV